MSIFTLHKRQFISKPIKDVFSFFQQPENLSRITPPHLNFKIITPSPIEMKKGLFIEYWVHPFYFPLKWRSQITAYDPPHLFIDEQVKGPYKTWHHTHRFLEAENGTWIEDEVTYELPFGFLGDFVHFLIVKRQLTEIFEYRSKVIGSFFE